MIRGVDGQKAEKFYVGGSLLLASALGILGFSTKQWTYVVCTSFEVSATNAGYDIATIPHSKYVGSTTLIPLRRWYGW